MPVELKLLVWSAILVLVQSVVAAIGAQQQVGNRDDMPALSGWAGRAMRAHRNILETLVVFAIAVLVANATGRLNATTALGANLFFWARLVYAVVYVAGITWVRTAVWAVSVAGILLVLSQLL